MSLPPLPGLPGLQPQTQAPQAPQPPTPPQLQTALPPYVPSADIEAFLTRNNKYRYRVSAGLPRVTMSISAFEGAGKSNFLCTLPGEHLMVCFDKRPDEVIDKHTKLGRKISVLRFTLPETNLHYEKTGDGKKMVENIDPAYKVILNDFETMWADALRTPSIRSLSIDNMGALRSLIIRATMDKSIQIPSLLYQVPNARAAAIVTAGNEFDKVVVFASRCKYAYSGDKVDYSRIEIEGPKGLPYDPDVVLRLWAMNPPAVQPGQPYDAGFRAQILKDGINGNFNKNIVFSNSQVDFRTIMYNLMPHLHPTAWGD